MTASPTPPRDVSDVFARRRASYLRVLMGGAALLLVFLITPVTLSVMGVSLSTVLLLGGAAIVPVAIIGVAYVKLGTCPSCGAFMGAAAHDTCPSCGAILVRRAADDQKKPSA